MPFAVVAILASRVGPVLGQLLGWLPALDVEAAGVTLVAILTGRAGPVLGGHPLVLVEPGAQVAILTGRAGPVLAGTAIEWADAVWLRSSPAGQGRCWAPGRRRWSAAARRRCDPHRPGRAGAGRRWKARDPSAGASRCDPHRPGRAGAGGMTNTPIVFLDTGCDPHRPGRAGAGGTYSRIVIDTPQMVAILTGRAGPVLGGS